MPASYPSSIKSFPTFADSTDIIFAANQNDPNAEIVAVETGLLNGFQHDLKPLSAGGFSLGTTTLPWAALFTKSLFTTLTITDTGTKNDYAIPSLNGNCAFINCNNASLLTITGIAGGVAGQVLIFYAGNAQVDFVHNSGASSAANRLGNRVTSGNTSLALRGTLIYLYTGGVWALLFHDQGAWITPAFSAGNYTGSGSLTVTVDSGDVTTNRYRLDGSKLTWMVELSSISTGGTASTEIRAAIPGGFTMAGSEIITPAPMQDAGAAFAVGMNVLSNGNAFVRWFKDLTGTSNWSNAAVNNTTIRAGTLVFDVS